MRFLLDEHLSHAVAQGLRSRGIDAVALTEPSYRHLRAASDEKVLEAGTEEGRVVVTHDFADFTQLHRDWILTRRRHAGIVLVPRRFARRRAGVGQLVGALHRLVQSGQPIDEQLIWLWP